MKININILILLAIFALQFQNARCQIINNQDCEYVREALNLHPNTRVMWCSPVELKFEFPRYDFGKSFRLDLEMLKYKTAISITLQPTESLLADKNTTVWAGYNYGTNENETTYDELKIKEYTTNLIDFRMYHDVERTAAMIVFFQKDGISVEGFIGKYVLRCLPRKKNKGERQYYIMRTSLHRGNGGKGVDYSELNIELPKTYNLGNPDLKIINLQILVAMDWSSTTTPDEEIKTVLMYYNAADMLYRNFTSPKIQLTLKGIIIPQSPSATPYLRSTHENPDYINSIQIMRMMSKYFVDKSSLFDLNSHDVVFVMTNLPICISTMEHCPLSMILTPTDQLCSKGDFSTPNPTVLGLGHPNFHGFYGSPAWILNLLIGGYSIMDTGDRLCGGFLNLKYSHEYFRYSLMWPNCTINRMTEYFKISDCQYFERCAMSRRSKILSQKNNNIDFHEIVDSDPTQPTEPMKVSLFHEDGENVTVIDLEGHKNVTYTIVNNNTLTILEKPSTINDTVLGDTKNNTETVGGNRTIQLRKWYRFMRDELSSIFEYKLSLLKRFFEFLEKL